MRYSRPRPLAPLHDIARQTQKALLAAIAAGNREAIFTAALDELERGPPALVVLEDMHWADDATLDLFKFLSRRIHRTHALLVITYRDDELGPRHPLRFVLGELPGGDLRRLRLVPLSESAVTELADDAGVRRQGCAPSPVAIVLSHRAAGCGHRRRAATVRDAVLARALRLSPAGGEIAELSPSCPAGPNPGCWNKRCSRTRPASRVVLASACCGCGWLAGLFAMSSRGARSRTRFLKAASRGLHARVLTILAGRPRHPFGAPCPPRRWRARRGEVLRHAPQAAGRPPRWVRAAKQLRTTAWRCATRRGSPGTAGASA